MFYALLRLRPLPTPTHHHPYATIFCESIEMKIFGNTLFWFLRLRFVRYGGQWWRTCKCRVKWKISILCTIFCWSRLFMYRQIFLMDLRRPCRSSRCEVVFCPKVAIINQWKRCMGSGATSICLAYMHVKSNWETHLPRLQAAVRGKHHDTVCFLFS